MRRMFVSTAFLALVAVAPVFAERLYVPVVGATDAEGRALATEIWVANGAAQKTVVRAGLLGGSVPRNFGVAAGGAMLERMAAPEKVGLIAIDAAEAAVSAWIPDAWGGSVSEVPVIGPRDSYADGATPGLEFSAGYQKLLVGAANVSDEDAVCEAVMFGEGYAELGRFEFSVPAKSLVRQDAAETIGAAKAIYAQVGCNREFYPIGVTVGPGADGGGVAIAKGTGPNGTCDHTITLTQQAGGSWTTGVAGLVHEVIKSSNKQQAKGIVCIQAPKQLNIARAIYEWDVVIPQWSSRDKSGMHNLAYFFLERYRSGVIGNINAAGPNKSIIKFMQNVGMQKCVEKAVNNCNTNAKGGLALQLAKKYHVKYTFDAHNKRATLQIFDGVTALQTISEEVRPGNNQTLVVKPFAAGGLATIAEFSNYFGQHKPEEAAAGMKYSDLKVVMVPK